MAQGEWLRLDISADEALSGLESVTQDGFTRVWTESRCPPDAALFFSSPKEGRPRGVTLYISPNDSQRVTLFALERGFVKCDKPTERVGLLTGLGDALERLIGKDWRDR